MARTSPFPESTRDRLRQLSLFAELDDRALDRLAGLSRVVHLPKKSIVFREGEPYGGMYVVLDGLAVVYKMSQDGRMLILHVCRSGDTLAEVPLFEDADAGFPAYAKVTRDSDLLFLPHAPFVKFLKAHPAVSWDMMRRFASRLKEATLQLEEVTLREVASRVARYLLREAEAAGVSQQSAPSVTLPLAKSSIASYLGTVHETLSRTFARLIREKIIAVDGPRVTILDVPRLQRFL